VCQICSKPAPKPTEEHAFPDWSLRLIKARLRESPTVGGVLAPGWLQAPKVVLKPVCRGCQSRLNELFESPATALLKEMITGSAVALIPRDEVLLASWALKTAIVLALARDRKPTTAHLRPEAISRLRGLLVGMMGDGLPPPNSSVRLARASAIAIPARVPFIPTGIGEDPKLFSSLVNLIPLVCECVFGGGPVFVSAFVNATKDDNRFLRVWPQGIAREHRWPPASPIAFIDTLALADEWHHPPHTRHGGVRMSIEP
jgi:hypothetical protein